MAYLLDTNILLRFTHRHDPAHLTTRAAIRQLRARGEALYFTPQNAAEVWNVVTRPADRNGLGFDVESADQLLRLLERLFLLLPETPELYPAWRRLVRTVGVSGVQVHDARLVAAMHVHGIAHVLTFNTTDFSRFEEVAGITVVAPSDVQTTSGG